MDIELFKLTVNTDDRKKKIVNSTYQTLLSFTFFIRAKNEKSRETNRDKCSS